MSVGKFMFICSMGLLMNLLGSFLVKIFNLPVFLDTSGTIFIAALGGYMPGITIGFLTNLFKSFFDPIQMYFCSVSVLIAILTTYFARKGFFNDLRKALILVPMLTLLVGGCAILIEFFVETTSFLQMVGTFQLNFVENLLYEFLDKTVSIMLAFALVQKVPAPIKRSFRLLGQRQAPLSDEIRAEVYKENDLLTASLRTKMLLILMLSAFFVSFSIAVISCLLFRSATVNDRIKAVDGIVSVVLNELEPSKIDDYIKYGRDSKDYRDVEQKLYGIKNSSIEVKFLYVYRFTEEGCQVIFDINTANLTGDKPGTFIDFEPSVLKYKDDLIIGRPIPPIITDDKYGYLMTLYKPLYDNVGKCQCYAAVDFSMDTLTEYTQSFIAQLLILFAGCFVFIFVLGLWFVDNNIVMPLNTMAYCAKNVSYDNPDERKKSIERIKSLKIKTGDEIENLYAALIQSSDNISKYLESLQIAKIQVENMKVKVYAMDELANTDSLTGIRNKTAYATTIAKLDQHIEDGDAEFCIVMVDVNFLKKVNDNYGHERGNEYLINACRLVCSVFGTEHVYRIGGDEFVVVISGDKVSLCRYFVKQFQMEMDRKNTNELLEPWEKISAAVGIAFYDKEKDKSADEVFKRADALMYQNKLAMKAQRTD
ncbi:MAG: GGDEF domain-containing protein [Selenomonadaceae bacterium]|nr:GGDEF domain-containing protein [Selenomonadaceae bacterium]